MKMEINGSTVSYEVIGEGVPVIALHGFGGDREAAKGFLEPVLGNRTDLKRIYPDLPAMGDSVASSNMKSTDDMLEILLQFIDQVVPGQKFMLAGLSYGGYLVRGIIHKRAADVLGMLAVGPVIEPFDRQLETQYVCEQDEAFLTTLTSEQREAFSSASVILTREVYDRYIKEIKSGDQKSDPAFLQSEFRTKYYGFTFDPDEHAENFTRPVTMLTGRQDGMVGYKDAMALCTRYPSATFLVLDHAGHFLQIEHEPLASAHVEEWVRRCLR